MLVPGAFLRDAHQTTYYGVLSLHFMFKLYSLSPITQIYRNVWPRYNIPIFLALPDALPDTYACVPDTQYQGQPNKRGWAATQTGSRYTLSSSIIEKTPAVSAYSGAVSIIENVRRTMQWTDGTVSSPANVWPLSHILSGFNMALWVVTHNVNELS